MERIVRHITQQLVNKLPERKDFFTPDQLRDLEIPEFIVERIQVEMMRNLDDSVVPPYTEWADMNNETVRDAWEKFIDAILAESRMPKIYAQSVFETAVADTVEILIQPRHNIPEAIFGPDRALDLKTIEKRVKAVTVYKHLSSAVLRYMKRRNLQALTYEQCENIIDKVDEKLVEQYHPLNWTQLLSPLFELLGNSVDTNLLRLFFEDKGRNRIARKFDLLNSQISKTEMIEVLSAPDLLDLEGYEDSQNKLFGDEGDKKSAGSEQRGDKSASGGPKKELYPGGPEIGSFDSELGLDTPGKSESKLFDKKAGKSDKDDAILSTFHKRRSYYAPEDDEFSNEEMSGEGEEYQDDDRDDSAAIPRKTASEELPDEKKRERDDEFIHTEFLQKDEEEKSEADLSSEITEDNPETESGLSLEENQTTQKNDSDPEDEKPLHKLFILDETAFEEKEIEEEEESVEDAESLNSIFVMEEHDMAEIPEDRFEDAPVDDLNEKETESDHDIENPDQDAPMWKKFLEIEEFSGDIDIDKVQEKSPEELPGDAEESEKREAKKVQILDLAKLYDSEDEESAADQLLSWLSSDKLRFIREIFNDSEEAYITAINEISEFDNWKNASRYLEKDVFSKHMIDMYSDEAVDFTDSLHSFFREYKSSQTTGNG
ncbi:MAG TPA: hypothetical protein VKM36_03690 [Balneolaceae bacterium]|nr:hypothetical protein [Balneolaceae bacterium]